MRGTLANRLMGGATALLVLLCVGAAVVEDQPHVFPLPGEAHAGRDPLLPLIGRQHAYFAANEVNGVTMDSRYPINPSEAIRMGVVSQLLGYAELAKLHPRVLFRDEVQRHADFLVARLDSVRSGGPFDGMLGYSLVQAFEQTGDSTHLAAARIVIEELEAIPTYQCVLNGGLMVAMATADWANLTGDPVAAQKTRDILSQLAVYQNADGSFPHWCTGSEDIHYTGWMAFELVLLQRMTGDPTIERTLARMRDFIAARLDSTGESSYTGPCDSGPPGCLRYYDSQHSGCGYDYDTRDWTVEPAYSALLLDHFGDPLYRPVMGFLLTLEKGGTFSDKYGDIPPPSDPEYPWSIADTSVANMSINFWALATILTGRPGIAAEAEAYLTRDGPVVVPAPPPTPAPPASAAGGLQVGPVTPAPVGEACTIHFSLAEASTGSLVVYDAAGRRVRALAGGPLGRGPHAVRWDRRDEQGGRCPAGVYWARLRIAGGERALRLVLVQ